MYTLFPRSGEGEGKKGISHKIRVGTSSENLHAGVQTKRYGNRRTQLHSTIGGFGQKEGRGGGRREGEKAKSGKPTLGKEK